MKKHGAIFFWTLVPTGAVVAVAVFHKQTLGAIVAGVAGILLHWWLSRVENDDGELADSSYFFGFVLTLVFLAVGLYSLGLASKRSSSQSAAPDTVRSASALATTDSNQSNKVAGAELGTARDLEVANQLLQFLEDLAAGLSLTIVGLVVRQVRTLSSNRQGPAESTSSEQRWVTASADGAENATSDAASVGGAKSTAEAAAARFDQSMTKAVERLTAQIDNLELAVSTTATEITRSAGQLGDTISGSTQRIEEEMSHAFTAIKGQRTAAEDALRDSQQAIFTLRTQATEHLRSNTELWDSTLEKARTAIANTHREMDEGYTKGIAAFADTARAFHKLSEETVVAVNALPNPADRLVGLWDNVRKLETELTETLRAVVEQLAALKTSSIELSGGLGGLTRAAKDASSGIASGGQDLRDTLQHEVQQLNLLIEEYARLVERTKSVLQARR